MYCATQGAKKGEPHDNAVLIQFYHGIANCISIVKNTIKMANTIHLDGLYRFHKIDHHIRIVR
jgi:hypothetical protein